MTIAVMGMLGAPCGVSPFLTPLSNELRSLTIRTSNLF